MKQKRREVRDELEAELEASRFAGKAEWALRGSHNCPGTGALVALCLLSVSVKCVIY